MSNFFGVLCSAFQRELGERYDGYRESVFHGTLQTREDRTNCGAATLSFLTYLVQQIDEHPDSGITDYESSYNAIRLSMDETSSFRAKLFSGVKRENDYY